MDGGDRDPERLDKKMLRCCIRCYQKKKVPFIKLVSAKANLDIRVTQHIDK